MNIMDKPGNKQLKLVTTRHKSVFKFIKSSLNTRYRILDQGCREGLFLERLRSHKFNNLVGIDICPEAINKVKEKDLVGYVGNIETMGMFSDREFDFVNSSHVLEHCKDPIKAMAEIHRVLKDDGLLMLEVPIQKSENTSAGHYFQFPSVNFFKKFLKNNKFKTTKIDIDVRKSGEIWVKTLNRKV